MNKAAAILFAFFWFTLVSCTTLDRKTPLYSALGGQPGIENLVDTFIDNIGNDEQIFRYFADANVERFRSQFIVHVCSISGGPCNYSGDSMEDIHTGMNINEADFNRVVELLIDAMEKQRLPLATQNRLLAILAPMRETIINR